MDSVLGKHAHRERMGLIHDSKTSRSGLVEYKSQVTCDKLNEQVRFPFIAPVSPFILQAYVSPRVENNRHFARACSGYGKR